MRRNLSYRKPAPIYIPSPPISPPSSPTIRRVSISPLPPHPLSEVSSTIPDDVRRRCESQQSIIPELPSNWREAITKALATEDPSQLEKQPPPEPQTPHPEVDEAHIHANTDLIFSATTCEGKPEGKGLSRIPSTLSKSSARRARWKAHQSYRPPTPPLPSCRDLPETETVVHDPFGMPELRQVTGMPTQDSSEPAYISSNLPYAALRSNTSFGTEKTLVSLNPSIPSTTWSGATFNSSGVLHTEGGIPPIYYVHAQDKRGYRKRKSKKGSHVTLWDRVGTWGTSVRLKLRRFRQFVGF